jgi:hypothetical protein
MTLLRADFTRTRSTTAATRPAVRTDAPGGRAAGPPPWSVLCPEATVFIDVGAVGARAARTWLRSLPAGIPVALSEDHALSRLRLRLLARTARVAVQRELVVLPRCADPVVVLDDAEASVRRFWTSFAAVPPGVDRAVLPASLAVWLAARMPWSWTGAVAPGRLVLGRRR